MNQKESKNQLNDDDDSKILEIQVKNLSLENEEFSKEYERLKQCYYKLCHSNSDTMRELERERCERKHFEQKFQFFTKETTHVHFKLEDFSERLREWVIEAKRTLVAKHTRIRKLLFEQMNSPKKNKLIARKNPSFPKKKESKRSENDEKKRKKKKNSSTSKRLAKTTRKKRPSLAKNDRAAKSNNSKSISNNKKRKPPIFSPLLKPHKRYTDTKSSPRTVREGQMTRDLNNVIQSFLKIKNLQRIHTTFLKTMNDEISKFANFRQASHQKFRQLKTEMDQEKKTKAEIERNMKVYKSSFEMENLHKKEIENNILPRMEQKVASLLDEKRYWDSRFEELHETNNRLEIRNFVQKCLFGVTQIYEQRNHDHYANTVNLQNYIHYFHRVEKRHEELSLLHSKEKQLRSGRIQHLNNENRLLKLELRKCRAIIRKSQEEMKFLGIRLSEEKKRVGILRRKKVRSEKKKSVAQYNVTNLQHKRTKSSAAALANSLKKRRVSSYIPRKSKK